MSPGATIHPPSTLVLGTLHGQADAIRLLAERGWTVYSCGHRAEGPGVDEATEFFLVDILDVDAVADLAERLGVGSVYTVGSDIAMPTVSQVSERLGLPCFHPIDLIETLHRKANLRAFLDREGLSPVAHCVATGPADLAGFTHYPAIVKPSDSQGQRGITIVENEAEAREALPAAVAASNTATAVVEELLDGPEVSVHVMVVDGAVRFSLPSDRYVWDGPMVGVAEAHVIPSAFLGDHEPAVTALIGQVVDRLGVVTGPLYFQLKLTGHGPRIVEIAPRLDGCHLWRLVEMATGVNLITACYDLLHGGSWPEPPADHVAPGGPLRLEFMLSAPDRTVRRADWPSPESCRFEEFQADEGEAPRRGNPVVARVGYRIVEEPT